MKTFLIAGKAGSGKGEIAKIIKNYYGSFGKRVLITEFSKYLKMYAKEVLNWDGNEPKPRRFLQDIGVTIRDNMEMPLMLVNRLMEDLRIYELYFDIVIISDVRFPEEIEEFKKKYGANCKSIYVINQFEPSKLSIKEQTHITETALENYSNFDIIITNDNKDSLEGKVIAYLERGK